MIFICSISYKPLQSCSFVAGCLCSFTSGQVFSWPAPALPKLRSGVAGFTISPDEEAWMVAATFIGNLLSPIPAGYIMDRIGRKNSLWTFCLLAIGSWVVIYFGKSAIALYVARTMIGAWAGFLYTVVPVLVGEVVSPSIRGAMGAMFGIMLYLGAMYESLVGMYVSYTSLALYSMLPPVLLFLIFFFLPETPYYYLIKGDRSEAARSLEWLRGVCNDEDLDDMEASVKDQLSNKGTFVDIFRVRAYRRAFIMVEVLAAVQRFAGLTLLLSYASVTIPNSFITGEQSFTVLVSVWILGSCFSFFIMDKFGRKVLLFISSAGSCLSMLAVSVWYFLRDSSTIDTGSTAWFPLLGLIINGAFYAVGLVSIPTLVQGELFPVNIKGKSSALACITMSVVSGISVRIYQPLTDYIGVYMNFVVCAVACVIGAIFACTYMIETRGRTLENIQDILSEKKRKGKSKHIPE